MLVHRLVSAGAPLLMAASLFAAASQARADDEEGARPSAPTNVPTASPDPTVSVGTEAGPRFVEERPRSSTHEPTFEAETTRQTWPNVPLLATGATVFGASYLPAVIGGAIADAPDDDKLYIPVAGPWMMLSQGPEEEKGYKALLVVDGVAQGLGALMMLTSFFIPEKTTERWYLIGSNDVRLTPTRLGTGFGMGATGRF